ncbi:hypothetical protein [Ktedonobacter robiniae]|uniref:Uncharacterized protein n=1 Tax=Ktedonobacter robiniae TaxID=2778365 RepID=A0ABQ3US22_9CHLR|nr:hypothetical protein [Ktedonobacter robiniae]GHO55503.1 hypothetical protein KSB_39780 [Ktedonobacter robiniae]
MIVAYKWMGQHWCPDCAPREADAEPIYNGDDMPTHLWCALCRVELEVVSLRCADCAAGHCFANELFLPPVRFIPNSPEAWAAFFERQERLQAWTTELYLA